MNTGPIAHFRRHLKTALEQAVSIPVVANMPERLNPPCIILTEGTPLLSSSEDRFGHVTVYLEAVVICEPATNELTIERLDSVVDDIVVKMSADYLIHANSYQGITTADGQRYLAAVLTFHAELTI